MIGLNLLFDSVWNLYFRELEFHLLFSMNKCSSHLSFIVQVAVFSPTRSVHVLNVTRSNVVKVWSALRIAVCEASY